MNLHAVTDLRRLFARGCPLTFRRPERRQARGLLLQNGPSPSSSRHPHPRTERNLGVKWPSSVGVACPDGFCWKFFSEVKGHIASDVFSEKDRASLCESKLSNPRDTTAKSIRFKVNTAHKAARDETSAK